MASVAHISEEWQENIIAIRKVFKVDEAIDKGIILPNVLKYLENLEVEYVAMANMAQFWAEKYVKEREKNEQK